MTIKKHIWEAWSFLLSSIMVTLMIVALTWWVLRQTKESVYTDLKYMLEQNLGHNTYYGFGLDRSNKQGNDFLRRNRQAPHFCRNIPGNSNESIQQFPSRGEEIGYLGLDYLSRLYPDEFGRNDRFQ